MRRSTLFLSSIASFSTGYYISSDKFTLPYVPEYKIKSWYLKSEYDCESNHHIKKIIRDNFNHPNEIKNYPNQKNKEVFASTRGNYAIWKNLPNKRYFKEENITLSKEIVNNWYGWYNELSTRDYTVRDYDILLLKDDKNVIVIGGNRRLSSWFNSTSNEKNINIKCYTCVVDKIPDCFLTLRKYEKLVNKNIQMKESYSYIRGPAGPCGVPNPIIQIEDCYCGGPVGISGVPGIPMRLD